MLNKSINMHNRARIEIAFAKNNTKPVLNSNAALSNSSSNGESDGADNYKRKVNKSLIQIQDETSNAIEETIKANDPEVYDYDEAYDEICKVKERDKVKTESKEPKYMKALIESSQRNRIETIMMKEKVLSDRLKRENGKDDVPVFITKKYKEVLDNLTRKNLPQQKEENDTIQNTEFGMMGFYSHLLTKNKLYSNPTENEDDQKIKREATEDFASIYNKRKKEYERNIPEVNIDQIKAHQNKPEIKKDDNLNPSTKEEYLSRYLQRKKDRGKIKPNENNDMIFIKK